MFFASTQSTKGQLELLVEQIEKHFEDCLPDDYEEIPEEFEDELKSLTKNENYLGLLEYLLEYKDGIALLPHITTKSHLTF